eukprot:CAMPEP_0172506570 /NCGR_PEP_ID=MMETSP1066-20121228/196254_1 /TAXON_ID=671091 /ORGANISM="Coscinodiscus wailesii, Strain CCMP2513" /LENGTH=201 /DNA_ID=CAMNT_0013283653 /DNA_START=23 /DNA_END=624 /DNA_ORIENTATION=+
MIPRYGYLLAVLLHLNQNQLIKSTTPSIPLYYDDQLVNHFLPSPSDETPSHTDGDSSTASNGGIPDDDTDTPRRRPTVWSQRYYASDTHFKGPGHPIFLVMGGEGAIPPKTGLFYPFVTDVLARAFGAFVLQPEHRFYGASQPLGDTGNVTNDDLKTLMTSEQAMWDAVRLVRFVQTRVLGCSIDRRDGGGGYCPVITVGG